MSKKPWTLVKCNTLLEGHMKCLFYAVPTSRIDEFVKNSELFNTSADAKAIFEIDTITYEANIESFNAKIQEKLASMEPHLGVIGATDFSE